MTIQQQPSPPHSPLEVFIIGATLKQVDKLLKYKLSCQMLQVWPWGGKRHVPTKQHYAKKRRKMHCIRQSL